MAKICEKCLKSMDENQFYTYRDGSKTELCKKCLTLHIDNFKPDTYLWIIEKMDVPYIPAVWNDIRDKAFAKDPYKMNGMSVIGKYLSKMKLTNFNKWHWKDTDSVEITAKYGGTPILTEEQKAANEAKNEELQRQLEAGMISEAEYKTLVATEILNENLPPLDPVGEDNSYNEKDFVSSEEMPDLTSELTQEEKVKLAMKWGRLYKLDELLSLEQYYTEYDKSFDLHNADLHRGTLQLCKLDLKSHQALDTGDIDGYSKLARASDSLRKSLKFTEAQRKEDKTSEFSCYGQLVAFAEMHNDEDYISPIDLSIDRDVVDKDIKDIKHWTKTLVEDDPTIYKMIEQYIKKRDNLNEMEKDQAESGEDGYQITDEDMIEYRKSIEEQQKIDNGEEDD